jgi:hypothetical protein
LPLPRTTTIITTTITAAPSTIRATILRRNGIGPPDSTRKSCVRRVRRERPLRDVTLCEPDAAELRLKRLAPCYIRAMKKFAAIAFLLLVVAAVPAFAKKHKMPNHPKAAHAINPEVKHNGLKHKHKFL